ncbi:GntR family transcriptional regulator [Nonomuraea sp. NPDC004702]
MSTGQEYTDARPLQVRMADDLRRKIETGELDEGARLPTYDDLARDYLCSVAVARKAVDLLRQQGLVITKQGLGSFVRERSVMVRHGVERYARRRWKGVAPTTILGGEAQDQGRKATRLIRNLSITTAPALVAERLGIAEGADVWTRKRTTFLDGRPNQLADSYYPLAVVQGTSLMQEETGPGGDFARLDEAGHSPTRIREEWHARMPSCPERAALRLPDGTPVIDFIRTIFDQSGAPVEVMLSVIAADTTSFIYEFPVPD